MKGHRPYKCFICGEEGHKSYECPNKKTATGSKPSIQDNNQVANTTGSNNTGNSSNEWDRGDENDAYLNHLVAYHTVSNAYDARIDPNWILLDNQSTVDIFVNKNILTNIRQAVGEMTIHSHGGSRTTNLIADLPGYASPVWYDANGIANILSLSNVQRLYKITFDSTRGNEFVVHLKGRKINFIQCPKGLYFYDTKQSGSLFLATVNSNRQSYTNREVRGAEAARKLQRVIMFPTTRQFKEAIRNNVIKNCPVTVKDIEAAEDIFGPDIYALKGRTTRQKPNPVEMPEKRKMIPKHIRRRNHKITLC